MKNNDQVNATRGQTEIAPASESTGIRLPQRTVEPAADCLFCDGEDTGDLCSDKDSKAMFYWIQCSKCEACGPTSYNADEALRLWNRT